MRVYFTLLLLLLISSVKSQPWERILGLQNRPEAFQNLCESYDYGYFILGIKDFIPQTKGFIIKTDINGFPIYEVTFGVNNEQRNIPQFISTTVDGGVIICGAHENWSEIGDISVVKLDACSDLEWCTTWRTDNLTDWGKEIHQLEDGSYIMLVQQNNDDSTHVFLYCIDQDGKPLWSQPYVS